MRTARTAPAEATSQIRIDVARFFVDLRRAIGANIPQAAQQLGTSINTLAALERADASALPPWSETQRVVMGYAAWAGIDGRPVLTALGILVREEEHRRQMARQAAAVRPAVTASAERLRQIQLAITEGARRLPKEALKEARERPVRTFYALSMPLALLLLTLNSHFLKDAAHLAGRPLRAASHAIGDAWAVTFAPHRDGFRWIEVSNPRSRRGDLLGGTDSQGGQNRP